MSIISRLFGRKDPPPPVSATSEPEDALSLLNRLLAQAPANAPVHQIFGGVSDGFWFWANTEGIRRNEAASRRLPTLPDETTQRNFTGATGDDTLREAFTAYLLFKEAAERSSGRPLAQADAILDFGCGWGRITRYFLRDLPGERIYGIDCYPEVVQAAKQTNPYCQFSEIAPMPPVHIFADNSFDLIYAFSVYSHLSEEAATRWLVEFKRLLKPGGVLAVTTRARDFIEFCAHLRKQRRTDPHLLGPVEAFPDTQQALQDYDAGKYLYSPVGGGGVLDASFFGETCIPRGYVEAHWTKHLEFVDYITDRRRCVQNVIVMKK